MAAPSPTEIREEILRCGRDPVYFIRKYVKIKHPKRGLIPFSMFEYQEELVRDYVKNRFNIVLKARQLGISEVTAAYATWLMLFHKEKNIIVMASKAETAKNIIRKVETAIKKVPRWLLLTDIVVDNRLSIELSNGSRCKAIATSEDAGRSEAVSFLIIDEAAFVPKLDELWTGLYPTVSAGGSVAVLSTPNGVGNKFYQLYMGADDGSSEFVPHRYMWWLHPERIEGLREDPDRPGFMTSPWFEREIAATNMSPREVAQELECAFNGSGETFVDIRYINRLEKDYVQDPMEKENVDRNVFIWLKPQHGEKYMLVADVARGDGRDHSAFHIFRSSNMEQVAEYRGKLPPDAFAKLCCEYGHRYNDALLVVENVGIGLACLGHIGVIGYPNVYYSRKGDNQNGEVVNTEWGTQDESLVPGFTTSAKTRPLVLEKLEEFIRKQSVVLRSKRIVEELKTFIWNNGRAEAQRGFNDDLVLSAAMGCWVRDTFLVPSYASEGVSEALLSNISLDRKFNDQIPGANKDPRVSRLEVPLTTGGVYSHRRQSSLRVRMPGGREEDFSWLISKG